MGGKGEGLVMKKKGGAKGKGGGKGPIALILEPSRELAGEGGSYLFIFFFYLFFLLIFYFFPIRTNS